MEFKGPKLNQPEKKKTPAELAADHINLEFEKADKELRRDKFWGRVAQLTGYAMTGPASYLVVEFIKKTGGDFGPILEQIERNPESGTLLAGFAALVTFLGLMGLKVSWDSYNFVERAKEKAQNTKDRILSQYLNRRELTEPIS